MMTVEREKEKKKKKEQHNKIKKMGKELEGGNLEFLTNAGEVFGGGLPLFLYATEPVLYQEDFLPFFPCNQ
jgi:hypothetical protein